MDIVYGTTNEAKFSHMKERLKGLDVNVSKLENKIEIKVEEVGKSPLENARLKATEYYSVLKKPIFSCDSGLYIDNIDESKQPGVYVRRVNGKELTDEEMIEYYGNIAKDNGGALVARYINAICFIIDENHIYEYEGEEISSSKFLILDKAHEKRIEGFPLDSLSAEITSKRYYLDLKEEKTVSDLELNGFRRFFIKSLEEYKSNK